MSPCYRPSAGRRLVISRPSLRLCSRRSAKRGVGTAGETQAALRALSRRSLVLRFSPDRVSPVFAPHGGPSGSGPDSVSEPATEAGSESDSGSPSLHRSLRTTSPTGTSTARRRTSQSTPFFPAPIEPAMCRFAVAAQRSGRRALQRNGVASLTVRMQGRRSSRGGTWPATVSPAAWCRNARSGCPSGVLRSGPRLQP